MTDQEKQDDGTLDLEDLEFYVIMGVKKEGREPITVVSANISLPEMAAMLGRAQASFQLQLTQAGIHQYQQNMQRHTKHSPIIQGVPPFSKN